MHLHPEEMITNIARCMYIIPLQFVHTGYDWTIRQQEWDMMNQTEKGIWLEKAQKWLNDLHDHMPDAYQFYIENWMIPGKFDINNLLGS